MTRYRITHKTEYFYEEPASLSYNEARLVPRNMAQATFRQECLTRQFLVDPTYSDFRERHDFFGNTVLYFTLRHPHQETVITTISEVDLTPVLAPASARPIAELVPLQTTASLPWEEACRQLRTTISPETLDALQFTMPSPLITIFPALTKYAALSFPAKRPLLEATLELMARIYQDFYFVSGATTIATPLSQALKKRRGVCQDFAQIMIGCLRAQGLAARYMSGYIETIPPPGQEKLAGADASHAWCAVYIPPFGWLDFDPTNNLIPQEQHIVLAWGRDFSDVTPLKGVFFSHGQHKLKVAVDVARLK